MSKINSKIQNKIKKIIQNNKSNKSNNNKQMLNKLAVKMWVNKNQLYNRTNLNQDNKIIHKTNNNYNSNNNQILNKVAKNFIKLPLCLAILYKMLILSLQKMSPKY